MVNLQQKRAPTEADALSPFEMRNQKPIQTPLIPVAASFMLAPTIFIARPFPVVWVDLQTPLWAVVVAQSQADEINQMTGGVVFIS